MLVRRCVVNRLPYIGAVVLPPRCPVSFGWYAAQREYVATFRVLKVDGDPHGVLVRGLSVNDVQQLHGDHETGIVAVPLRWLGLLVVPVLEDGDSLTLRLENSREQPCTILVRPLADGDEFDDEPQPLPLLKSST